MVLWPHRLGRVPEKAIPSLLVVLIVCAMANGIALVVAGKGMIGPEGAMLVITFFALFLPCLLAIIVVGFYRELRFHICCLVGFGLLLLAMTLLNTGMWMVALSAV